MKIYFSGGSGLDSVPETLVPQRRPRIMLTFYDITKTGTADRLRAYLKRKKREKNTVTAQPGKKRSK